MINQSCINIADCREKIETKNLKLPDNTVHYDVAESNKFLSFATSNFESDLGQTTVPYIDIQDVTTTIPYPMAGAGIYYRKSQDDTYAGFIALKLKSYDFSRHLP